MLRSYLIARACTSCLLFAAPALAQAGGSNAAPAPSGTASTAPGDEIVVPGYRYLDVNMSGITNLPLSIDKASQSISLPNSDFVKSAAEERPKRAGMA
jgi:hypothetical protein